MPHDKSGAYWTQEEVVEAIAGVVAMLLENLSSGDELLPGHLPQEIVGRIANGEESVNDPWERWLLLHPPGPVSLEDLVARTEQHFLRWALKATHHNRTRAAELLGFAKVDQLRYLLRKYEMD